MFSEVHSGLSSLTGQFRESVRDQFGQAFFSNVLEPLIQETNALVSMQESADSELANLDMLRFEIAAMRSGYE